MMREMRSLCCIVNLEPPAEISVQESDDVKPEVFLELAKRGLTDHCPQEGHKSAHQLHTNSIFDLLGDYLPGSGSIIVYTAMCRLVSEKIGVALEDLVAIVRLHEEAHAATHLGRDEHGGIWKHFGLAPVEDKELAAQILTFLYCKASDRPSFLATFRALADSQHEPYNTWREYEASSPKEIAALIRHLRRRTPTLIIDYAYYGGGPIGLSAYGVHYRIKGTGALLHILGPRSGVFGPGSSRPNVVVRKAIAAVDFSQEPLRNQILTLLATPEEVYNRWPATHTNCFHISSAIIDILEGLLDLEPDHLDFRAFKVSEDVLARLLTASREAMSVDRQGSLERHGVMDASFHQITLYVDGKWKTWWGNVGWHIPALEELDQSVRLAAKRSISANNRLQRTVRSAARH